ncbi:MAG: hypothetical protein Ct9H300mP11_31470 [Chloroflexota bacterium]|nr:MAG: hypothetical protein Ct9H300mP11_31470 [Chloroflexota bacterium]
MAKISLVKLDNTLGLSGTIDAAEIATAICTLSFPCQWLVTAARGDHSVRIIGAISE